MHKFVVDLNIKSSLASSWHATYTRRLQISLSLSLSHARLHIKTSNRHQNVSRPPVSVSLSFSLTLSAAIYAVIELHAHKQSLHTARCQKVSSLDLFCKSLSLSFSQTVSLHAFFSWIRFFAQLFVCCLKLVQEHCRERARRKMPNSSWAVWL